MPAVIDATVGGENANAYLTEAEAESYLAGRVASGAWDGASQDERVRAIISATRRLDQEAYRGRKSDPDQALEWPRADVYGPSGGLLVDVDRIPRPIKNATGELALALLASPGMLDASGLEPFEKVVVGPLEVTPAEGGEAGALPDHVRREIRPFLKSARSTRLVRG